jgi:hypothetical protein
VQYHGHLLTIVYDEDGTKYKLGKGLAVFLDGKRTRILDKDGKQEVVIGKPVVKRTFKEPADYALNITRTGYPVPSASVNSVPDTSLYQAIDGRVWYFPEITNRWTTKGSLSDNDWYTLDFGRKETISNMKIYLVADSIYGVPDKISIEYKIGKAWKTAHLTNRQPRLIGNTGNTINFDPVQATAIRIKFRHAANQIAVSEIECH